MTGEGHFIFGQGGPSVSTTSGGDALADYIAEALADPVDTSQGGPAGYGPDRTAARNESTLVHEAPGVLGMLDIHMGLDSGDESVRFLARAAAQRGIQDPEEFRTWVANLANDIRSRGLRLSADALVYHLREMEAVHDRYAKPRRTLADGL